MRIDRYEILGRLAEGGMAEVLLARMHGPHGFERPVVLKRILPHLAPDKRIVDLFLDEARIISNLRHPNLINVQELGSNADGLYIVMEYLEGESVAGLCRRLAIRNEDLPPTLAAHILAEACAGLHAAHEAKSQDGRPLELVHRDVSPQNIFVSYSGAVHVIDFGIATTTTRRSRTEAGTVRGKIEYLAPEQLRAVKLDRRTDVFALGIVLFELVSGRRAYRRASTAQTFQAILSEPPPQPSKVRPGTPAAVDALCARALAKEPADRFQTAAEMRRELLGFIRKQTVEDPGEHLGKVMQRLFADRIAEKAELLRRVRGGDRVVVLPQAEVDVDVEMPTVAESPTNLAQTMPSRPDPTAPSAGAGRRIAWPSIAAALVLAGAVVGMGAMRLGSSRVHAEQAPPPPAVEDAVRTPDLPAATVASPPPTGASPDPLASASSSQAAAPDPAQAISADAGARTSSPRRSPSRAPAQAPPKPAGSRGSSPALW